MRDDPEHPTAEFIPVLVHILASQVRFAAAWLAMDENTSSSIMSSFVKQSPIEFLQLSER